VIQTSNMGEQQQIELVEQEEVKTENNEMF